MDPLVVADGSAAETSDHVLLRCPALAHLRTGILAFAVANNVPLSSLLRTDMLWREIDNFMNQALDLLPDRLRPLRPTTRA